MSLYRFYILIVGLLPFLFLAVVYSDFWGVVGKLVKLNRWQRKAYAKWKAWKITNKAFNILWKESGSRSSVSRKAFKMLKKDKWRVLYQKNLENYLSESDKYKHPLEAEYEERERGG